MSGRGAEYGAPIFVAAFKTISSCMGRQYRVIIFTITLADSVNFIED